MVSYEIESVLGRHGHSEQGHWYWTFSCHSLSRWILRKQGAMRPCCLPVY